jgi:hypothetical protein
MPQLRTRSPAPTVVPDTVGLPPKFPGLPADVLKRFPSLETWVEDADAWWTRTSQAIQGNNRWVSQSVTKANKVDGDLRVSIDGATAAIVTERTARITEDEILARRVVTVSAIAGVSQNIKVQGTAPVGPALNDYWVDNSDPINPVTYQWDGAAWAEVTTPISAVAVADERTARITADGYLEGKYTLTVTAGNVVTGMNITSASGGGTDISSVIFRATDFQIYNGSSGVAAFSLSGGNLTLSGSITLAHTQVSGLGDLATEDSVAWADVSGRPIDSAGRIVTAPAPSASGLYLGSTHLGFYASGAWKTYMDNSGNFYLSGAGANGLAWNGTTLTINGEITSTSGTIGGFTIGSSSLSGGSGESKIALNPGGSYPIELGVASGTNYYVYIRSYALAFAEGTNTKAQIGVTGSAGVRSGVIQLMDSSNNTTIQIEGSTGTITCDYLYVG